MRLPSPSAPATYLLLPPDSAYVLLDGDVPAADVLVIDLPAEAIGRCSAHTVLAHPRRPFRQEVWLRVPPVRTAECARYLDTLAGLADGLVISQVRSVDDLEWVEARCPGTPLIPVIDNVAALPRAPSLARHTSVIRLGFAGLDASADLSDGMLTPGNTAAWVHRLISAASVASGLPGPVGGLHPTLQDLRAVVAEASLAVRAGFTGYCVTSPGYLAPVRATLPSPPLELGERWRKPALQACLVPALPRIHSVPSGRLR
ncbi:hypothetical protein [Streptomyces sp. NPDC005125]